MPVLARKQGNKKRMSGMKKLLLIAGMTAFVVAVCAFNNIDSLYALPLQTPQTFLDGMPYREMSVFGREFILIQPSSTFFVYLLGVMMMALGAFFLASQKGQKSRLFLGYGFLLWGVSALAAGTSYQAFGYELKCRGREFCLFTSEWELVYMLLAAYCINCLMVAVGYETLGEKGRNRLIRFAVIDSVAYSLYMLIGSMIPNRFMISYEGFIAFVGINFVILFAVNVHQYAQKRDKFNRSMIVIWIAFVFVNAGYFVFLYAQWGTALYERYGLWFNENDALHVLLIAWAVLIFILIRNRTGIEAPPAQSACPSTQNN